MCKILKNKENYVENNKVTAYFRKKRRHEVGREMSWENPGGSGGREGVGVDKIKVHCTQV